MEKIIRHIETLLRRHDYVIIPELGGFVLQNQSSVITPESIEPPLTIISFNPLMKNSDGLLAIELSRAGQISFREAVQLISSEIALAKTILEKGKVLELGNLGILTSNTDHKVIFRPTANSNFIPSNYGLGTLHVSVIQKTTEEEKRVIQLVLPSRRNMVKYAAVVAVVAGLFFGAPRINEAYRNFANLNPTYLLNQSENKIESAVIKPLQVEVDKIESVVQSAEANYHVIVSCMATQKDADEYCKRLKSLSYQNAQVLLPIKTYRIAINSFATKEEAIIYMQELRKTKPQFADAWVLSE